MNRKGFTLVELISVLVVLALIVLVAFPNILKAIQNTDSVMNEATKELLLANSKSYFQDNFDYNETKSECVNVSKLVKENYTKSPISSVKPENSKKIEEEWSVSVKYTGGKWVYTVNESKC
jgi:prepilin-type N-terminal cleavage/methylation domain